MNTSNNELQLTLSPEEAYNDILLKQSVAKHLDIDESRVSSLIIVRRSIDARHQVKVLLTVKYALDGNLVNPEKISFRFKDVSKSEKQVVIVGSGPAGLFAALRLLQAGIRPVIIERGKSVDERNRDIATLNRNESFDPESNYAYGEGGAGTYSDGKLYTRSTKKGDVGRVLQMLCSFGAADDILFESHPHIGTDKLPLIIKALRELIIEHGGSFLFSTKVNELIVSNGVINGVITADGKKIDADAVVWATGHSAKDNYRMLQNYGVTMEAKGFAMGIRVEHPQELINTMQYNKAYSNLLPPANYFVSQQIDGRGVYSFCMCPGGQIVAASTESNAIVVNGMSNSKRNSDFANAGLVVEIRPEDIKGDDIFRALIYQEQLEQMARMNGAPLMKAPAQALADFANGKLSAKLPENSYHPGVIPSPMHFWMPTEISSRLQTALKIFGKRMYGFLSNQAIAVGVESRTSSPVRILRDKESWQSVSLKAFYPCGEGAGYAGGIVSSALDGDIAAQKIAQYLNCNDYEN